MVWGGAPRGRRFRSSSLPVLLWALWLPTAGHAADWLYTVRPGDNLWTLADRYLSSPARWPGLARYNGLDEPDRLIPGSLLRIPVAWLRIRPVAAELVAARGQVELLRPDGASGPAGAGARLGGGEILITGAEAAATVRLAGGTVVEIGPESRVAFDALSAYGKTGMIASRLGLATGRVRATVPRGTGGLSIQTPAATAAVRGTAFRLASDLSGTRAEGLEGVIGIESAGIVRRLVAGTGTLARPGAPPARVRPLLPPPRVAGPIEAESVPQRVVLEPIAGAVAYRLELLGGPSGEELLHSRRAEQPELRFDLPNGGYRIRARGIDADGVEGRDLEGEIRVHARPEPPVPLRPRPGGIEREGRPRFAWAAPEGAEGYRFELRREGEPAPLLTLELAEAGTTLPIELPVGTYSWRVATRAMGEIGPLGPSWRFERRPPSPTPEATAAFAEAGMVLRWPELAAAQRREVQLAREAGFAEVRFARSLDGPELTLPWPEPGRWYLRTRILEADGEAGPWSVPQAIDVPWRSFWPLAAPVLLAILAALL
jgi:hypothetical protein